MKIRIVLTLVIITVAAFLLSESVPRSTAQKTSESSFDSATIEAVVSTDFADIRWRTMVNNGFKVPNTNLNFSSYGQPSVNTGGMIVFRGRSTGGGMGGGRITGVYARQPIGGVVRSIADINTFVPYPNNLNTEFTEFPSIPRLSINAANIATRGNHQPVYRYLLPDDTETRAGTTGIYAKLSAIPLLLNISPLVTGASKLGAVPGFEDYAVPNISPYLQFDVFPGSPAITDSGIIAFKGNYTENGIAKTGVFYRRLSITPGGGGFPVQFIANSDTQIPNAPPEAGFVTFGSTAPPSAAGNQVVFVGLDNEDNPSYGGIYIAPLQPNPTLRTLAGIGAGLPGLQIPGLTRLGEGLSFDGRYLAFWGAWGKDTKTVRLYCPTDGNAQLIAYCSGGDPNSVFDPVTGKWYQEKQVPVNQGIFVYDVNTNRAYLAANSANFSDFIFWVYSGRPPGVGHSDEEEDGEPPRWRGSAFMSVSDGLVAFKARTGNLDDQNVYVNPVDGIYLADIRKNNAWQVIFETGMDGAVVDPSLQPGLMSITGLGIERDGFRGKYLTITASMANEEESWGGIYLATVNRRQPFLLP